MTSWLRQTGYAELAGLNFQTGAVVRLGKAGEADIPPTILTVVSTQTITCAFDLTGATTGAWDVVVTNPTTETGRLPGGFEVKPEVGGTTYLPVILKNHPPPPPRAYPYMDTMILSGDPNRVLGAYADMWVGYDHCYGVGKARSLIMFDLSEVPVGAPLERATLRLYLFNGCDLDNRSHTVKVYRITESWSSTSATWNNQPRYDDDKTWASAGVRSWSPGWYSFDVTALVKAWLSGQHANHGLLLRGPESSSSSSASKLFYTMDASGTTYDPRIDLAWVGLSGTGTVVSSAGAEPDEGAVLFGSERVGGPGACAEPGFTIAPYAVESED